MVANGRAPLEEKGCLPLILRVEQGVWLSAVKGE